MAQKEWKKDLEKYFLAHMQIPVKCLTWFYYALGAFPCISTSVFYISSSVGSASIRLYLLCLFYCAGTQKIPQAEKKFHI